MQRSKRAGATLRRAINLKTRFEKKGVMVISGIVAKRTTIETTLHDFCIFSRGGWIHCIHTDFLRAVWMAVSPVGIGRVVVESRITRRGSSIR